MFLTKAMVGTLIQRNRGVSGVYDDEDTKEVPCKVCPYNQDIRVAFGVYTIPEAKGYFIVKCPTDIKEGDQLIFGDRTYSILEVRDNWIWNKIENYTVAVK
jgi:hypothetical protein